MSPRNRPMVRVLHATKDAPEDVPLEDFIERCWKRGSALEV